MEVLFMKISSKGRYALAALTYMAQLNAHHECITIIRISEKLGISKIYLEQVFSLLKRAGLVHSIKGAGGGYELTSPPEMITVNTILQAVETSLFEHTESSSSDPITDKVLMDLVWNKIDQVLLTQLESITLDQLAREATRYADNSNYMFYI